VLSVFHYLGVPVASEKTEGPSTTLIFLGIELDSTHMRTFMRRLYDATTRASKPYHHIQLSHECHLDLLWWSQLLKDWSGKSFFLDPTETSTPAIRIETDASGAIGYGAVYGDEWLTGVWQPHHLPLCITFKELYPICIACSTWGHRWHRKRICFHTDNEAVARVIGSGTSRCPSVMSLLRQLFFICAEGNFMVTAQHIPGVTNTLADALSRGAFQRFRSGHPTANRQPTKAKSLPSLPGETPSAPCTAT